MNKTQEYLNTALSFSEKSESSKLSVYSSILTINSVLIGACGIMQSINHSLPKNTILTYLIFSLVPICIVFSLYIGLHHYQTCQSIQNVIKAINSSASLMDEYKHIYEKFKDEDEINYRPKNRFILERMSIFFTILNMLFFIFIIYCS